MASIEVKNLIFTYPNEDKNALSDISFEINEGELVLVYGLTGSGKSTLLRLLKREIAPFGKIGGLVSLKGNNVGYINQNIENNIVTDTVFGELAFALQNTNASRNEIYLRVAETASYFNLNGIINDKIDKLSGGIKQLVSLASIMTLNPDVLLLDEPCSQLDPTSTENFLNVIRKLNKEKGLTILCADHSAGLLDYADKVVLLNDGKLELAGSPEEFRDYVIENNHKMKEILPSYTRALTSHPLEFSKARTLREAIIPKKIESKEDAKVCLKASNIAFAYGKGQRDILFDLDYKAYDSKINAIVGANGSGKTTFLKCISGVLKPYSGKIRCDKKIAYLPQKIETLFTKDTVREEVENEELLEKFGLFQYLERHPFDLSGGEKQKLAICILLETNADVLLLDEPTKGMDANFKLELSKIFSNLVDNGKTIVIVSHDIEFIGRYCDFASFLFDGKIISNSSRREFFSSLKTYTTELSRLTDGNVISIDDIEVTK